MKRNQVDLLFNDSARKRKVIIAYSCAIVLLTLLFIFLTCIFVSKNKVDYARYKENSNVDYKVYLKENDFFEKKYAESEKQYIASLIDYINATFDYNMVIDRKNVDFKYSYYIDANVDVKDRNTGKSLYSFSETLVPDAVGESNGSSKVDIVQNVSINYNKYNDLISDFVESYKLNNIDSTLTVNMYVKTLGTCDDFKDNHNNESVVSLVIPLTSKTIALDITNNLVENVGSILLCEENPFGIIYAIPTVVVLLLEIVVIVLFVKFIVKNRTATDVYRIELKKIVSNYHSYIQKVNNGFDLSGYRLVAVDTFNDMLEIRDTLQQPILMVESRKKTGVHFIIPSNTKLLYVFTLKELAEEDDIEVVKKPSKRRTKKDIEEPTFDIL